MQKYVKNEDYEILTPHGWESFDGVIKNEFDKNGKIISFEDGTQISATLEHIFYIEGEETKVSDMQVGMRLDTLTGSLLISNLENTVLEYSYDIHNTNSHKIACNGLITHQCDELAFVPNNIAVSFWTAVQPVLAEGGGCIVTSTPKNDEDQFAQIWKGANVTTDDYGNDLGTEIGENGFFPIKVAWWEHPDRDEEWAAPFRASLGKARFAQEFECLVGDTMVDVQFENGSVESMSLRDLHILLGGE